MALGRAWHNAPGSRALSSFRVSGAAWCIGTALEPASALMEADVPKWPGARRGGLCSSNRCLRRGAAVERSDAAGSSDQMQRGRVHEASMALPSSPPRTSSEMAATSVSANRILVPHSFRVFVRVVRHLPQGCCFALLYS